MNFGKFGPAAPKRGGGRGSEEAAGAAISQLWFYCIGRGRCVLVLWGRGDGDHGDNGDNGGGPSAPRASIYLREETQNSRRGTHFPPKNSHFSLFLEVSIPKIRLTTSSRCRQRPWAPRWGPPSP